jgi:hypothetical protein
MVNYPRADPDGAGLSLHEGKIEVIFLPGEGENPTESRENLYLLSGLHFGQVDESLPPFLVYEIEHPLRVSLDRDTGKQISVSFDEQRLLFNLFLALEKRVRRQYALQLKSEHFADRLPHNQSSTIEESSLIIVEDGRV